MNLPIARHQFPLGVVAASLAMVLRAGTRLRRVADVLAMHWRWCNLDVRNASDYSVRLWLLRLGLHVAVYPRGKLYQGGHKGGVAMAAPPLRTP